VEIAAHTSDEKIKSRDYYRVDAQTVGHLGSTSGYMAALVFSLYIENNSHTGGIYREPRLLCLAVCRFCSTGSAGSGIITGRGQMPDDPVKYALRDRVSMLCVLLIGAAAALARFTPDWLISLLAT
jgi:hypothetical protein